MLLCAVLCYVQVVFNPKDTNTFASASLDRTVKVWSLGQPMPNFTLEGHEKGVNTVDYFTGVQTERVHSNVTQASEPRVVYECGRSCEIVCMSDTQLVWWHCCCAPCIACDCGLTPW